jgi:hypothetical protein
MSDIKTVVQSLGDAIYIYLDGDTGLPPGIHEVQIGPRLVRLYANVTIDVSAW